MTQRYAETTTMLRVLKTQGRSLVWLARAVGLSENYVWQMTHGRRRLTGEFARAASQALGVPVELLFLPTELRTASETDAARNDRAAD